ncbi:MAG: hypothetical protein IJ740_17395 [Ruminococcus sp.]|nr:hypothetical protein [Ruminococcus sp.]
MTVIDLFYNVDRNALCYKYLDLCRDIPKYKYPDEAEGLSYFIDKLLRDNYEVPLNNKLILCHTTYERFDGEPYPSTAVYTKEDIEKYFLPIECYDSFEGREIDSITDDEAELIYKTFEKLMEKREKITDPSVNSFPGRVNGYDYIFTDWSEILGYTVPSYITTDEEMLLYAAAILHEMTFFGLDESVKKKKLDDLTKSLEEADRMRKLPVEEQNGYFKSYDEVFGDLGLKDERTYEQKVEDERKRRRNIALSELSQYREVKRTYTNLIIGPMIELSISGDLYEEFSKKCKAMNVTPETMMQAFLHFCAEPELKDQAAQMIKEWQKHENSDTE